MSKEQKLYYYGLPLRPVTLTQEPQAFVSDPTQGIALTDLLGDDCPEEEPEHPKFVDGYPFQLPELDEDDVDLTAVDIADTWTTEQRFLYVPSNRRSL